VLLATIGDSDTGILVSTVVWTVPSRGETLTICPTELARTRRSPARIGPTQSIRPFLSSASR
jgi:hypothetical protein